MELSNKKLMWRQCVCDSVGFFNILSRLSEELDIRYLNIKCILGIMWVKEFFKGVTRRFSIVIHIRIPFT